jgi:hypothetical protein
LQTEPRVLALSAYPYLRGVSLLLAELVKWIVGIAVAQVGTVIAVLKLFPATGHG